MNWLTPEIAMLLAAPVVILTIITKIADLRREAAWKRELRERQMRKGHDAHQ